MGKSDIKAVVFDLGNVLVDFDHMVAARKIFGLTKKTPREIFDLFFDSELVALFEEDKISPLEFFAKTKEMLGLKLDYEQFLPVWNKIFFFTENNRQVYNLAKSLKKRYKVALLSNINALHFDYLKKNFPVFDAFQNIITSFEAGARKPAPLIYKKALDLLGVLPQDTFYTDDRTDLIEKACSLGIHGFVFKSVEQLKKDLLDNAITLS
ncbi:MAG: HAD family phosphatase [Candidatus Omnitrophica bacterium]|nr:HAD family phosphatase [Candidatus Omnitrophota bacterium]